MIDRDALNLLVCTMFRRSEMQGDAWKTGAKGLGSYQNGIFRFDESQGHAAVSAASSSNQPLIKMLELTLFPIRFELDAVGLHRGVASAGGVYPIEAFFVDQATGLTYVPDPEGNGLRKLRGCELAVGPASDEIVIHLVARLDKLFRDYADLSLFLASLETGMIACQIGLLAREAGWRLERWGIADRHAVSQMLRLAHWGHLPLFSMTLKDTNLQGACDACCTGHAVLVAPEARRAHEDRAPLTKKLLLNAAHSAAGTMEPWQNRFDLAASGPLPIDLEQTIRSRSSDTVRVNSAQGQLLQHQNVVEMLEIALRLLDHLGWPLAPGMRVELAIAASDRTEECARLEILRDEKGSHLRLVSPPHQPGAETSYTGSLVEICMIAVDEAGASLDMGSIVTENILAGMLAQCMCLAASAMGWNSRPVRYFDDVLVNSRFPIDRRALLKLEIQPRNGYPFDLFEIAS